MPGSKDRVPASHGGVMAWEMRAAIWSTIRAEATRLAPSAQRASRIAPAASSRQRWRSRIVFSCESSRAVDRVGYPLHGCPALDRERLVAGHGVHDGTRRADLVAHLHEEFARRGPDRAQSRHRPSGSGDGAGALPGGGARESVWIGPARRHARKRAGRRAGGCLGRSLVASRPDQLSEQAQVAPASGASAKLWSAARIVASASSPRSSRYG